MRKQLSNAYIEDLLRRVDITKVVGDRVQLSKKGGGFSCRCPFHDEDTPSFVVSESKQIATCFGGCFEGKGMNAIKFLMEFEQCGFVDAVKDLCREAGIEHPFGAKTAPDPAQEENEQILAALNDAHALFQERLGSAKWNGEAADYLKGRGITGKVAKDFEMGLSPNGWRILFSQLTKKFSQDVLKKAGLISSKNGRSFDFFRDRIMFPIKNRSGQVIAFGGRRMDGEKTGKYINSPDTPVFSKSHELFYFHEAQRAARKAGEMYVVEGYMDVIAHAAHGLDNTCAPLGTSFTEQQLEKVLSTTKDVVACFDGDAAGRRAAWKTMEMALPLLSDGVRMKFLFFPDGHDPDSLLREEGIDAYSARLNDAKPLSKFVIGELLSRYPDASVESRTSIAHDAAEVIGNMPQGIYREVMLEATAKAIRIDPSVLAAAITKQHPAAQVYERRIEPNRRSTPSAGSEGLASNTPKSPAPTRPNHFSGEARAPGMMKTLIAGGPQFNQFSNKYQNELSSLKNSNQVEQFCRDVVSKELKSKSGNINSRYLADNLCKVISDTFGNEKARAVSPNIRKYCAQATDKFNSLLAEEIKHSEKGPKREAPHPDSTNSLGMR